MVWPPASAKAAPTFGGCGVSHRSPMALTAIVRHPSEAVEYITTASEGRRTCVAKVPLPSARYPHTPYTGLGVEAEFIPFFAS
jgi:hypothetical protein